jgi:hypothetical protein
VLLSRDDFSMINADYATFFSNLPLEKINQLEVHLLHAFNFCMEITREEHDKMSRTINDLITAASSMHLSLVAPLPSPHGRNSGDLSSISGRIQEPFHHSDALGYPGVVTAVERSSSMSPPSPAIPGQVEHILGDPPTLEEDTASSAQRRVSVQIAVTEALSVLVKSLARTSAKVYVTNESSPLFAGRW